MKLPDCGNVDPTELFIESPFRETTRNGKHILRSVLLTLTPCVLFITEPRLNSKEIFEKCTFPFVYFVDSLKLTVFKKSQRQTLKICFDDESFRYFELAKTYKKEMMWAMWCKQVVELQQKNSRTRCLKHISDIKTSLDWNIVNQKWKRQHFFWNDKYLYLGSKREHEDQNRPSPVPGLGRTDNIKLLYLKPQYFGCWDQSEHWVQCESSKHFNIDTLSP